MLVNMAVWHITHRDNNQYLCLKVGGLEHHRFRSSTTFYSPALKKHGGQETMCSELEGLCPLTVASCRVPIPSATAAPLSDPHLRWLMSYFL